MGLSETDALVLQQVDADLAADTGVQVQAGANGFARFVVGLDAQWQNKLLERHKVNEELVYALLDNPDLKSAWVARERADDLCPGARCLAARVPDRRTDPVRWRLAAHRARAGPARPIWRRSSPASRTVHTVAPCCSGSPRTGPSKASTGRRAEPNSHSSVTVSAQPRPCWSTGSSSSSRATTSAASPSIRPITRCTTAGIVWHGSSGGATRRAPSESTTLNSSTDSSPVVGAAEHPSAPKTVKSPGRCGQLAPAHPPGAPRRLG